MSGSVVVIRGLVEFVSLDGAEAGDEDTDPISMLNVGCTILDKFRLQFLGVSVKWSNVALAGPWNFRTLLPAFSSIETGSVLPQRPIV